ncbi:MAG: AAA family ATPase, partial [Thermomicrobiales bacterium]|nr:AAA family ATPase [Thermomicrobiales bacterium]
MLEPPAHEREPDRADEPGDEPDVEAEPAARLLDDHPEIRSQWEEYLLVSWLPWAERDRTIRTLEKIYADLFSIYQQLRQSGESYEIVLAVGLLNWKTPRAQTVKRHIVTVQASMAFDSISGAIAIGPAEDGAQLALEQDMIEAQERPDPSEQQTVEKLRSELEDDVWQSDRLEALFSAWVHAVSPRGRYEPALAPAHAATTDPVIRLAPALILRRRTERSLIRMFQEIIDHLDADSDIPVGVRRLVSVVDDTAAELPERPDRRQSDDRVEDIYFPLPANDEQLEIVRRLNQRQGVLVQGPPGTGKSHTIANLVCHLLATGQRVLVTSHTPRALRVLKDKIPAEVSALCVSLLGNDRGALKSLEDSVLGITDRYNAWDRTENAREIAALTEQLDAARRAETVALRELQLIREVETVTRTAPFGDYVGAPSQIAERLAAEEPRYRWIAGQPVGNQSPPLSNAEALDLLRLLRMLSPARRAATRQATVASASLIPPQEFAQFAQQEATALAHAASHREHRDHPAFAGLLDVPTERRDRLRTSLERLRADTIALAQHPQTWAGQAATAVVSGQDNVWRHLQNTTTEHLGAIDRSGWGATDRRVAGLTGRDRGAVRADAAGLLGHLESGKGLGFGPVRPAPVKRAWYLRTDVRVDGRPCDDIAALRALISWLDVENRLEALQRLWDSIADAPQASFTIQIAFYQDMAAILNQVLMLGQRAVELRSLLETWPGVPAPAWHDPASVEAFLKAVDAATAEAALRDACLPLDALASNLRAACERADAHASTGLLLAATESRDADDYATAYQALVHVEEDRTNSVACDALGERLRVANQTLADALSASAAAETWDERLRNFEAAWNWARADQWSQDLQDPSAFTRRSAELQDHREHILATMRKLAAVKAWDYCFDRLTEPERQHLMAWMKAMQRVGKGTGKYAGRHRNAAREHMDGCRSAIPAWIMPIYRAAETIRPGADAFDVVIVDEASQSGPEALFLQFIGKKIVVVGDDKQISPEFVGLSREDVDALRAQHIADLPHQDALGVDNSFFDQADIRYGGRIRLREHFRCMPEIIQFSNNLAYSAEPLIPLRQYGADRLEPVLVRHVPDGYRKGAQNNVVNPPEAAAIVAQIAACCADPAYDGKTMGVISLQGSTQASSIEKLLLKEIGPEEYQRRSFVCGDAYDFQGDERDIIFLSLVAARSGGYRIGPLTSARDARRFNVAASRARDQMWLFHTAALDELNPSCLRHQLVSYCQNPRVEPTTFDGVVPNDEELVPPFDSLFEQRVFRRIQARGYRVVPQYEVAGYRIDLVVEGLRGRLAVECDGERWHGPDRYEADMARQRQLERCGWQFWRVRGGEFFRDPDDALSDLWSTLGELEIYPSAEIAANGKGAGHGDAESLPRNLEPVARADSDHALIFDVAASSGDA